MRPQPTDEQLRDFGLRLCLGCGCAVVVLWLGLMAFLVLVVNFGGV